MTTNAEGTATPSPPPPLSQESATVSPIPLGRHLWDLLAVHGPLLRHDLFHKAAIPIGEPWREYVRWNGLQGKKPSQNDLAAADRAYFDRALDQSLRRGWLVTKGDRLAAGECPPEHRALSTLGGVDAAGQPNVHTLTRRMIGDDDRKALDLLREKTNPARRKPFKRKVDKLRESLRTIGQVNDIICWHPIGQPDPIFVDGQTRYELLLELEVEPRIDWLPKEMSATHVLGMRIAAELQNTTKDDTKEARDRYIAELASRGFTQQSIAEMLGLSQQNVSKILKMADKSGRREVDDDEIAEMRELQEAGWTERDIAEDTGWSKTTVHRALTRDSGPVTTPGSNGTKPPTKEQTMNARAQALGVKPRALGAVILNGPGSRAAPKADPTWLGKFLDAENLELVFEHAYRDPLLRSVLDRLVAEHYRD